MDDLFGNLEDLGDALLTPVNLRPMETRDQGLLTLVSSENWSIFAGRKVWQSSKWVWVLFVVKSR